MNSINLVGRLTADPELRYTPNGTAVCSFTLAVDRPRVKDTTDFISCVAWRQPGEYLCKYGHKGSMTAVSGCLTSRRYEDKNGAKRVAFEVLCDALSSARGGIRYRVHQHPRKVQMPRRRALRSLRLKN